ncbi:MULTISPECIES: Dyp-type peroxidase [unclassified Arthrobacter]|uniref:Dyp-type peroxidase n=1 Tax=unclassified Arthrobacter TaxID=235627 RepID=UPI0004061EF8|nr:MULTISPECIES: Dyp-type peroxidase [unclassified Arthrobacter]PVE19615.1 Dyp-type peroxidase [Arthrobacter sp. Bz4]
MTQSDTNDALPGLNRRRFLWGGAATGVGAATAALIGSSWRDASSTAAAGHAEDARSAIHGALTVPFYGARQAGIDTPAQSHTVITAVDLVQVQTAEQVVRLMRLLTDDAARLTQGAAALADPEPELAIVPARLTVTFGFGERIVRLAGDNSAPSWLRPLPAFSIDDLDEDQCGGDLLIHVASEDLVTVSHAQRMLLKDTRSFGQVRWSTEGFRRAFGSEEASVTMRNLFGQVDGTANPRLGSDDLETVVWDSSASPAWLFNGTSMVIRKIAMDLDTWDELDRPGREESVGRYLTNGAPLTGHNEKDEPDFEKTTPLGFPVIAEFAHTRRARSSVPGEKIFRRAYNYNTTPTGGPVSDAGLLFLSYQADVDRQFVPLQQRLDELDLLNQWTTPIGSAVFAIPPGCAEGGFIGDSLFAI